MNSSTSESLPLSQHVIYVCSRLLAYGLPVLYFLVTTSFYLKTYDSAQVKITFTQIGGTALLLIWFIKILVQGRIPFQKKDLIYIAPFLAFLISGLFSWVRTPFKVWALEETLRRIFYMALALITVAEINSAERMARLWRWLLAAAWIAVGYGFIQFLDSRFFTVPNPGIDPFIWRQAFGNRVFSTFGNPNFHGNFLVIVSPLILSSVLRQNGSLARIGLVPLVTLGIVVCIDKMVFGWFGGYDSSYSLILNAALMVCIGLFAFSIFWRVGPSTATSLFYVLFAFLFLNLYSTGTKGAWLGFMAAVSVTIWLIFEYFLHTDERTIEDKKYVVFIAVLSFLFVALTGFMTFEFVIPFVKGTIAQMGFQILWIPTVIAAVVALATMIWIAKRPWNLKKMIYGVVVLFILSLGAAVLQYSKTRLTSVSFRLFTWIGTWEMIQTSPLLGNGVGTFKVIYPAHRRPQIIVLEGKSNTETDHAENEYLEVWQDEGIFGFGIFLWLIVTAIVCGLAQLRWFSKLRHPDGKGRRKIFQIDNDPRSFEVLGFLGAFIGALIHWFVDVSIRFVSSGIFSGLLPAALVAHHRNHSNPIPVEARLPYDRWIRLGVAGIWTSIFLWLGMEFVPQPFIQGGDTTSGQIHFFAILVGLALFIFMELMEFGLGSDQKIPFKSQYPDISPKLLPVRLVFILVFCVLGGRAIKAFGHHFQADVHHNLAIFFSKEGIWTRAPKYEQRVNSLPPDIREKYQKWGGALEHYQEVLKKNPGFPMAAYFTGNVYNDWGSQWHAESVNARNQGKLEEAQRLRERSNEMWDKSEDAYVATKKLAPNYVQTHHQMGTLYTKRAEQAAFWGEAERARQFYDQAYSHFRLYRMIDPVFPPNYDRMVQILLLDNKYKEAEELYKEAIYYNQEVARSIRNEPFSDRLTHLALSLAKIYYTEAQTLSLNPFQPLLPQVEEALKYFNMAVEHDPKNIEAWKGAGFLLEKMGRKEEAQRVFRKIAELSPNDPDLRFSATPPK